MRTTTILAVFAIVIAVGFVAATSFFPQASASKQCVDKGNSACSVTPGHDILPPPGQEEHLSGVGPGSASQYAPGHLK